MKKILLTAATAAFVLSSSAYAAQENTFYITAGAGWLKLNKVKSLKSKNSAFLRAGAGYYVMDNTRAELAFTHGFEPQFKGKAAANSPKIKAKVDSVLLNGYVDLFDVSVAKVFAGAGLGMSMVHAKYSDSAGNKTSFGRKNNFAWAVHVGTGAEVAPGVNIDLMYSFADYGKTKKSPAASAVLPSTTVNPKGHHVGLGVRFDL